MESPKWSFERRGLLFWGKGLDYGSIGEFEKTRVIFIEINNIKKYLKNMQPPKNNFEILWPSKNNMNYHSLCRLTSVCLQHRVNIVTMQTPCMIGKAGYDIQSTMVGLLFSQSTGLVLQTNFDELGGKMDKKPMKMEESHFCGQFLPLPE